MKRYLTALVLIASAPISSMAAAQSTFPSAAPNVRVGGTVMLSCTGGTACQPVSASSPLATRPSSGAGIATAQVSVGTVATLVAPARAGRLRLVVTVNAANACAFGTAGVTASTGFPLQPVAGASLTIDTAADVWAVCSATTMIGAIEQF